jgi:hypothetical protein
VLIAVPEIKKDTAHVLRLLSSMNVVVEHHLASQYPYCFSAEK